MMGACEHEDDEIRKSLQRYVTMIIEDISSHYSEFSEEKELELSINEMRDVVQTGNITALRTLVLHTMHIDGDLIERLVQNTPYGNDFLSDMRSRVLPVAFPFFLESMCQDPQTFVRCALVLHELWGGEAIDRMIIEE